MPSSSRKQVVIALLIFAVLGAGVFVAVSLYRKTSELSPAKAIEEVKGLPKQKIIGRSVEGRAIESYTYGDGQTHLLFIGGMHGGYEWNSVLLAYEFMDYLRANPAIIQGSMMVTVIPSANPDGVYTVVGKTGRFTLTDVSTNKETLASGRFNARGVDLNRNFDCKWKPKSTWQSKTVSAGAEVFSEPEAVALRDFVLKNNPVAVIFWHSQANAVYASECEEGILPETFDIMKAYSLASGYRAISSFDSYAITGDAEGWLASINIPAITVELQTHEAIEWDRNLSGIKALFGYYGKKTEVSR